MNFVLTLWTDNRDLAKRADAAGVDRIGLDLETLGKRQRQPGSLGTWITEHRVEQLPDVGAVLQHAALFARTNGLHPYLDAEIEQLLDFGVSVLMFPNFQEVGELETFCSMVGGRAKIVPLVERLKAANQIEKIIVLNEIDEIHVGVNDLAIDLGLPHRMAVLASTTLSHVASAVAEAGKQLGVGGLGRAGDDTLPIPSDLVYGQYPRLGATAALISRSFSPQSLSPAEFAHEIVRLRERMDYWFDRSPEELDKSRKALEACLATLH